MKNEKRKESKALKKAIFFFKKNRFLTFWFAEHFPLENVQHQQNVRARKKHKLAKIFFIIFSRFFTKIKESHFVK